MKARSRSRFLSPLASLLLVAGCAAGEPEGAASQEAANAAGEESRGASDPRSFKKTLELKTVPQSEDTQDYTNDLELYRTRAHFKAFATSPGGPAEAFGFGSSWNNGTVGEAISTALKRCREAMRFGDCELYTLGNILVAGMSAEELEKAKTAYIANPEATNDDL